LFNCTHTCNFFNAGLLKKPREVDMLEANTEEDSSRGDGDPSSSSWPKIFNPKLKHVQKRIRELLGIPCGHPWPQSAAYLVVA
jgi:hypothetical protein